MTTDSAVPPPPSYKETLNLPRTSFAMKANLTQREPAMVRHWAAEDIYRKIRAARANSPRGRWILHDGPPYANGDIHMGHLINKVLKDIVVKFRTMEGYDSPFVPGWDCHGLPIESAIQKHHGHKFRELTKDQIRKECKDYAMKYVKLQGESFQRLGIFGEFARPYLTLDPKYEAGILEVLAQLVSRDLVYRQKKPVHWCTFDRTALAEAELEYASRKDHSIYVMFPIHQNLAFLTESFSREDLASSSVDLLIWTTTPWTLPANRAVAVHPDYEYVGVYCDSGPRNYPGMKVCVIVAKELVKRVMETAGVKNYRVSKPITGRELVALNITYGHPIDRDARPIVLADYVTLEDGTGLVHTAPGHGKEDYQTGIKFGLEIHNPVLPDGRYDETVAEFLRGKSIWDANPLIVEHLRKESDLFHDAPFQHEYPHCWRCKKPVIFRATEQWFIRASGSESRSSGGDPAASDPGPSLSHGSGSEGPTLWSTAKQFVNSVKWIPAWGKNRIDGMLDTRPDWCISRQRSWGVPIPAFFDDQGNLLFAEKTVRRIAEYFRQHGADSWYTRTPRELLGAEEWEDTWITPAGKVELRKATVADNWVKSADILDVWFESGASHHAVLECTHPELGYPCAMYLEGSDQHRGWFQSALLEAAGYKDVPPFKEVLTHGFVVDEKGRKMSKSEGNDIKVADALKQYGADVMRLWVASVDYQNDIPCGPHLLAKIADAYRKIRNTMRYLLGNLFDFNPQDHTVAPRPHSIDAWMQSKVDAWVADIRAAYDRYEFHAVFRLIYEFCNVEISAVYAKAIKDRLYCELPDSPARRASQSVCYRALLRLIELSAPILVFTADEAWQTLRQLPGSGHLPESIHLHIFPDLQSDLPGDVQKHWSVLMALIEKGNKQLDDLKRTIGLGNPLDAQAVIILPKVQDEVSRLIGDYGPEIEDALGVGFHRVETGEAWDIRIEDTRQKYASCARSWKRRPDVGLDKDCPDLSIRDALVVRALRAGA